MRIAGAYGLKRALVTPLPVTQPMLKENRARNAEVSFRALSQQGSSARNVAGRGFTVGHNQPSFRENPICAVLAVTPR